ncbi:MAG: VTT domain-containing protein [Gemmatimonas sp.]|nr:VTT domain-containing protein [Gemmatimonadaceae bacterium]
MMDLLGHWVANYGFFMVAVFLLIEGAGVPVPGETALVTAAALAGRGTLSIGGVIIAGCIGTIAGGHAGYWLGARGGTPFIARYGRWIRLTEPRLETTNRFFEQHGAKTVMLGRFVAFLRSFVGIFAGISHMPMRTFATYNALGGSIWVVTFSALGYVFGRNLPRLVHYIGRVSLLAAILIALVAGVVFLWQWFAKNRGTVVASLDQQWERATASARMDKMRTRHPRVWKIVTGEFAREEYLAVHLLIGFAVSLAIIGIFASITEDIVDNSPLTRFDVTVAARLHESVAPSALRLFDFLSRLGGRGAMTILLFGGAMVYAVRRRGLELTGWCAAFIGGALLDAALRFVVRRSELPFADVVLIDWGTGLASGHALGVLVGYGMLAYLVSSWLRGTAARTAVAVVAIAMVVAITISRLYLGQHYISDASAGLASGLLWLTACISGIEVARQRHLVSAQRRNV